MMRFWKTMLPALAALLICTAPAHSEDFVLRAKYPSVKTISTTKLAENYDQTIIVDARARLEYDVVHINKAVNIPVAMGGFIDKLTGIRPPDGTQPIVFYCNGYTCAKSYKATLKAMEAGFQKVYAYDAGIYEWVTSHPNRATLMGRSPVPLQKLISKEEFNKRKIGYAEFAKRAADPESMVIDIREPFQRSQSSDLPQNKMLALAKVRNIPSDRLVGLLKDKKFQDRQLLITDAVGKQVEWLQYSLEDNGYRNYYFLKNGVLSAAKAGAVR
jgi:rhodanese-related sulfurtransferase